MLRPAIAITALLLGVGAVTSVTSHAAAATGQPQAASATTNLAGNDGSGAAVFDPPKTYYLSLGDSLGFGLQGGKLGRLLRTHHYRPAAFQTGYTDDFAARMRVLHPTLRVVNYSCPAESTQTMIQGGCFFTHDLHLGLHNNYMGPQLGAAVAFLRAHPDQVSPVTLNIGGKDLNDAFATCNLDPPCIDNSGIRGQVHRRLDHILDALRRAAPDTEIIVSSGPNAFQISNPGSYRLRRPFIEDMHAAATRHGARFVDGLAILNGGGRTCELTFLCRNGDPHPTDGGYAVLAQAFWVASGYGRLHAGPPTQREALTGPRESQARMRRRKERSCAGSLRGFP